jgi:indolepyruvate ferredoxin oxidoreductase, beta subunit
MSDRAIRIAVLALGGQGGGVLAEWIVKAGERSGLIAQSTSVPGVAQRTGATIYYIELFPAAAAAEAGKAPVLALSPTPGDVDVVIAAELMEAVRALARGFLSPKTTLIASTHRIYAIGEKIAMGDGRRSGADIRAAVAAAAGRTLWLDMEAAAEHTGAVISAVMLGALAGSAATPIAREIFEDEIRRSGRSVEKNLAAFAAGFEAALRVAPMVAPPAAPTPVRGAAAPAVAALAERVERLPEGVRKTALEGVKRAVDFQDPRHGAAYLDRIERILAVDRAAGGEALLYRLTRDVAKYLALAMTYDDVVRVADLKTRSTRFARFREDVRAAEGQIVRVFEYMHPRIEEVCDLLPGPMARALLGSRAARSVFGALLGKGRRVATTNLAGFMMLSALASLKFARRWGSRFAAEEARIEIWLGLIEGSAAHDYALACEIAALQRLIKGYSDTHARGLANYQRIFGVMDRVRAAPEPARALARLREAALKDEEGAALEAELLRLGAREAAAA